MDGHLPWTRHIHPQPPPTPQGSFHQPPRQTHCPRLSVPWVLPNLCAIVCCRESLTSRAAGAQVSPILTQHPIPQGVSAGTLGVSPRVCCPGPLEVPSPHSFWSAHLVCAKLMSQTEPVAHPGAGSRGSQAMRSSKCHGGWPLWTSAWTHTGPWADASSGLHPSVIVGHLSFEEAEWVLS